MSKLEIVDDGIPPERHPSFFSRYQPPASHVSALVQMPEHRIDGNSLSVAYMRDWRAARRRLTEGSR
jgi:hypothetical protein